MRGRILIIGLALAAVAIAFVASRGGDPERPAPARSAAKLPAGALRVALVYSPEKEQLLAPLIKRFNAEHHTSGGHIVVIVASIIASGDAETRIAKGTLRP